MVLFKGVSGPPMKSLLNQMASVVSSGFNVGNGFRILLLSTDCVPN